MKKILLAAFVAMFMLGCGDVLHNTPASFVTLTVKNLPVDGKMSFTGDFATQGWANGERSFDVTNGNGAWTTASMIITGHLKFTVNTTGSWVRPWYPKVQGNSDDFGSLQNIEVDVPMDGGTHEIILDASKGNFTVANITVK